MPMSNKETLSRVTYHLKKNGVELETQIFMSRKTVGNSEDTAMGEALISIYLEKGDYKQAKNIMASLAEKLTKAQTSNTGSKLIKENDT